MNHLMISRPAPSWPRAEHRPGDIPTAGFTRRLHGDGSEQMVAWQGYASPLALRLWALTMRNRN